MSVSPPTSAGLKLVALESNDTQRPSVLIDGLALALSPAAPLGVALTSVTAPELRSFMNTWLTPLVAGLTRLVAVELKTIFVPSPLRLGRLEAPLASVPSEAMLTRVTVPLDIW